MARKQKLIIHSFFFKQPSRLSKKTTMMHIATARVFVMIIETLSVPQALIPGLLEKPPWESSQEAACKVSLGRSPNERTFSKCTHRETFPKSCQIKPKPDCIHPPSTDLEPNKRLFGSKPIEKW